MVINEVKTEVVATTETITTKVFVGTLAGCAAMAFLFAFFLVDTEFLCGFVDSNG